MKKSFSAADAQKLVALARKAIAFAMHTQRIYSEECPDARFEEKLGVFVTLNSFPEHELRGCIGLPYPVKPLWAAVIEAATSAAFQDPRFPQLEASELEKVTVEISILTKPEEIKVKSLKELPKKIMVGRDGLIVQRGYNSGLLLPQVPVELKWNEEQFLCQCCMKAGLEENAWKKDGTKAFAFQAQVFSEKKPNGKVVEEKLN